ncbi:sorting nexin-19 [Tachyglossus aculeatus]|uniref:sorting nexin-19 n=1 Tax=Tachyglossus aculeatus TaxID=9261 RepID=UPI0018F501AD|nr:sorting nexin-19 [Tachyglossus aculeatus]
MESGRVAGGTVEEEEKEEEVGGTGRSPPVLRSPLRSLRLLGTGAALAWALSALALADGWLLGLLGGLLLALGGWLGTRLLLLLLHLPPGDPPDPLGRRRAQRQLQRELHRAAQKVLRDFVAPWHGAPGFQAQAAAALGGLARELQRRLGQGRRDALLRRVLLLCGHHLRTYLRARAASPDRPAGLWEEYSRLAPPHPALRAPHCELPHLRALADLLLGALVPGPHLDTRTGRFVLVELVACNVLLPLVAKLADPDCIHLLLAGGSARAQDGSPEPESRPPDSPTPARTDGGVARAQASPHRACPPRGGRPRFPPDERREEEEGPGDVNEEEEDADGRKAGVPPARLPQGRPWGPLFPCEDSEPDSPASERGKDPAPGARLSDQLREALTALVGAEAGEDGAEETEDGAGPGTGLGPCPEIQIDGEPEGGGEPGLQRDSPREPSGPCLPRPSTLAGEPDGGHPQPLLSSCSPSASSPTGPPNPVPFSFEPLASPDGPVVIQNLRITGTIATREHSGTGFHPYTLYTVKYETAVDGGNGGGALQQVAYHTVNRRYREFLNLQTRLEEKPDLRKFIKNVKGPKKLFPDLPFGNMDSDRVEARKSLLEAFLKQLCAIPEIANSEEVQEFLALNTDARIAFVKKPFAMSRIDKMVVNAIVDTLKTAFPRSEPQSPTEELSEAESETRHQTEGKKSNKSRLRFPSSKIAPAAEAQEQILYCLRESSMEADTLPLAGMESFIEKQEKLLAACAGPAPGEAAESPPSGRPDGTGGDAKDAAPQPLDRTDHEAESETALADTALDLLLLLMREQWTWLCTENMQKMLHLLFGTYIQAWLEVQMDKLTCPQRWVQYLRLLQESIWPGGSLPPLPKPARTPEQKEAAAEQALQSLMGLLPDFVVELLGPSKCRLSWELVLETLQQPLINRHLVFCLWDIILEFLALDIPPDAPPPTQEAFGNPKRTGSSA